MHEEVTDTAEIANDIYNAAIERGYTKKMAQALSLRKLELLNKYNIIVLEAQTYIRRQIPIRYLPDGVTEMNQRKINPVLSEFGFDQNRPYWFDICIIRENGQEVLEECLVGSERTDQEWCSRRIDGKRVASFAAQVASSHDPSLEREVRRMAGGAI